MFEHRPLARTLLPAGALACLLALTVFLATPARAADTAAEARALAALDDTWSRDAGTKDADKVAAYYAVDAMVFPPGAPAGKGRAAGRAIWAGMFALPQLQISWKTQRAWVAMSGELGYTSGSYQDSFRDKDGKLVKEAGKYLCVWQKQADGSWKAVQDMWNSNAP